MFTKSTACNTYLKRSLRAQAAAPTGSGLYPVNTYGDQFLSRGFSVHESCLRQGRDLWDFMHAAVHAFIANSAPPSLMPAAPALVPAPTG